MNRRKFLATALAASAVGAFGIPQEASAMTETYSQRVKADKPMVFYDRLVGNYWADEMGGQKAAFKYGHGSKTFPYYGTLPTFDGMKQYATVSIPKHGDIITVECVISPATMRFPNDEGEHRVHFMGKGQAKGTHEWALRIYSNDNRIGRTNRISGYVFAPAGGLGAGSYVQQPITVNQPIHLAFVINAKAISPQYPMGYTKIYRDGVLSMKVGIHTYPNVRFTNTTAPMRIGTKDFQSYFKGAIGKVAIYRYELPANRIAYHAGG